jgi:hypothetical protein
MMLLAGALALLAGCGGSSEPPETPAACLGTADDYLAALESAPGQVRLDGDTPISGCLVEDQAGGALQTVGKSVVDAATELNVQARRDPGGRGTVQLGYLVGAVQEGASNTGGIHQDLVLRLDAAARFSGEQDKPFPAEFERAYGEGYAAGQANG